jgi:hypothetical protein
LAANSLLYTLPVPFQGMRHIVAHARFFGDPFLKKYLKNPCQAPRPFLCIFCLQHACGTCRNFCPTDLRNFYMLRNKIMSYRLFTSFMIATVFVLASLLASQSMAATGQNRTAPIAMTSTALQAQGVGTSFTTVPIVTRHAGQSEVTVQMQFALPGRQPLALQAFDSRGEKIAQSQAIDMKAQKAGSTPVVFVFPKGANLEQAHRLVVVGAGDGALQAGHNGNPKMSDVFFR